MDLAQSVSCLGVRLASTSTSGGSKPVAEVIAPRRISQNSEGSLC